SAGHRSAMGDWLDAKERADVRGTVWPSGRQPLRRAVAGCFPRMSAPKFGLIIVGDEILSGKRVDKHLSHVIGLLGARGLALSWAEYVGDDREDLIRLYRRTFAGEDVVFSCGGIGS